MGVLQDLENLILSVNRLNIDGVPSASLAILEDGKVSSHVITNGKENADTVYQACSISKAITALAVAKLIDDGHITYDTKAADHLPQSTIECLVDGNTAHLMQHVTIEMLLTHTSGLSQHGFPGYVGARPTTEDIFSGRPPSKTPKMHFVTFPGAQNSYSGGGFTVLQVVLEDVIKMPFPEIMQRTVLEPLEMHRSWYGFVPPEETNIAVARCTAYAKGPNAADYHDLVELAAAGLWTTPSDLLKDYSEMLVTRFVQGSYGEMARGWFVEDAAFGHAGSNHPGYSTYLFGRSGPSSSRNGIAIMTNSTLGHEVAIRQIVAAVQYLKGWSSVKLPSQHLSPDFVPYPWPQGTSINGRWKEWIYQWSNDWAILGQDGPSLRYRSMQALPLRPAAMPSRVGEDGHEEIILVVDGLKVAVRLTKQDGHRVLQLVQDKVTTLIAPRS